MTGKKFSLGRGLGALIEGAANVNNEIGTVNEIDINKIDVNPFQPRTKFDEDAINKLAGSIKELGIIQPITVRKIDEDKYQLITGERRLRASKIAGLTKIPAFVRQAEDTGMLEMALVENIQREDLDSIEIAISYQRLIEECNLTQENLSDRIGKNRSTISNYLRLLKLPAEIQLGLRDKKISMGHARAIINIEDAEIQIMIYQQIIKYDFSVRKVEEIVKELGNELIQSSNIESNKEKIAKQPKLSEEYAQLKSHLTKHFKTNIEFIRNKKGKGKIIIPFRSDEELERIIAVLDKIS